MRRGVCPGRPHRTRDREQLYLSGHTVKTHMRHVYDKLGAHGRREAVETARGYGLFTA
jgi:ATP/maltotriose-dependent transcriptional regulator MalT